MNTDRLEVEEELLEKLSGPRATRFRKILRQKEIRKSAARVHPQLRRNALKTALYLASDYDFHNFSSYKGMHYPCAVDEFPADQDILHKLSFLPISEEIAKPESQKPVVCATCGDSKPVTAFYEYGSPSCRVCNTRGSRG